MKIERIANSIFSVVILTLLWALVPIEDPDTFQYGWRLVASLIVLWYGIRKSYLRLPSQIWKGTKATYKFCVKLIDNATLSLFEIDPDDFAVLAEKSINFIDHEAWIRNDGRAKAGIIKKHWSSYLRYVTFASLMIFAFNWLLGNVLVHFYGWLNIPVILIVMFVCIESMAILSVIGEDDDEKLSSGDDAITALALFFTLIIDIVQVGRVIHALVVKPVIEASNWYDATFLLKFNFGSIGISKAFLTLVGLFCLTLFFLANARIRYGKLDEIRSIIGAEKPTAQEDRYSPEGENE